MRPKVGIAVSAVVASLLALTVFITNPVFGGEVARLQRGLPSWKQGDWWTVTSDILVDDPNNPESAGRLAVPGKPAERSVFSITHRFVVEKNESVKGEDCDRIGIYVEKLPKNVSDDTEGKPLWTLSIRRSDGSLARLEWCLRKYPCYTEGKIDKKGSRDFPNHLPAVSRISQSVPLDVPLIPVPLGKLRALGEHENTLRYKDQWAQPPETPDSSVPKAVRDRWKRLEQTQTTSVHEEVVMGKRQKLAVVSIWGQAIGERTQVWVAGYPWWIEWMRSAVVDGKVIGGVFRAKLVSFGEADSEGKKVSFKQK